jgi:hypothetical protein
MTEVMDPPGKPAPPEGGTAPPKGKPRTQPKIEKVGMGVAGKTDPEIPVVGMGTTAPLEVSTPPVEGGPGPVAPPAVPVPAFRVGEACVFWGGSAEELEAHPATVLRVIPGAEGVRYAVNVQGPGSFVYYPDVPASTAPTLFSLTVL